METNWKKEILASAEGDVIISCTLSEDELLKEFNDGFGGTNGESFTAWSKDWVYFPIRYDGSEWVGRAPRHPSTYKCEHQGG
jgi:hypothetical protein